MGTRADFYVGSGKAAEWLGSIAWDGYRSGMPGYILKANREEDFRAAVIQFLSERDDATLPEQGWPWPWDTSATSDCSYWFFDGCCFDVCGKYGAGAVYLPCNIDEPDWGSGDKDELMAAWLANRKSVEFPDMSARKNVNSGKRSGVIFLTA